MKRVAVGMSGGIDSLFCALLLQQQGYEVIGVHLSLYGTNHEQDVEQVCRQAGIPLYVQDGKELFRKTVIEEFVREYRQGRTPSPCCICNRSVKWELLEHAAQEVGASRMATGHYVRIAHLNGRLYIRQGIDPAKDQSYFLWGIPPHILEKTLTPLGDYTKQEVKRQAEEQGFGHLVQKRESMGICFLQGNDYRDFVKQYRQEKEQHPGDIIDRQGNIIGRHNGLLNYTIGQKQGLPATCGEARYVAAIDTEKNIVVADCKKGLWQEELWVEQVKVTYPDDLQAPDLTVKIRGIGQNPQGYVRIEPFPEGKLHVRLSDAAWGVAPGQPVVFFRGELVIGGGIACKV